MLLIIWFVLAWCYTGVHRGEGSQRATNLNLVDPLNTNYDFGTINTTVVTSQNRDVHGFRVLRNIIPTHPATLSREPLENYLLFKYL